MDEPTKEDIRKAILAIVSSIIPAVSEWCTVKSVDWLNKTCAVILDDDSELVLPTVRLGFDKNGISLKPVVDTQVLVLFIGGNLNVGVVVMVEESEEIEIFGNEFGAIPVTASIVDRLNTIENKVNSIISTFNGHTHVSPPAPVNPVTTAPPSAPVAGTLTNTTDSDIEGKVKHGQG